MCCGKTSTVLEFWHFAVFFYEWLYILLHDYRLSLVLTPGFYQQLFCWWKQFASNIFMIVLRMKVHPLAHATKHLDRVCFLLWKSNKQAKYYLLHLLEGSWEWKSQGWGPSNWVYPVIWKCLFTIVYTVENDHFNKLVGNQCFPTLTIIPST